MKQSIDWAAAPARTSAWVYDAPSGQAYWVFEELSVDTTTLEDVRRNRRSHEVVTYAGSEPALLFGRDAGDEFEWVSRPPQG